MSEKAFKSYVNQNIVSILIQKGGFSFLAYDGSKIVDTGYVSFESEPFSYIETFIEKFESHPISSFKTEYVELSFLNKQYALIPKEDFNPNYAQNYLKAVHHIDDLSSLRFSYIPTKEAVVCFNYSEELEYYFEKKYSFVKLIHNASRNLDKVPREKTYLIHLIFSEDYVEMVGVSDKWDFYTCQEYSNSTDVAYLLRHYLKRNPNSYEIEAFGRIPSIQFLSDVQSESLLTIKERQESSNYPLISQ